jgi:hypothetical protein
MAQRLAPRRHAHHRLAQLLENRAVAEMLLFEIVDDEDAGRRLVSHRIALHPPFGHRQARSA